MRNNVFKACPSCQEEWPTRTEFIADRTLDLNGYKADFEKLEYGLFFFTHIREGCFSTLALEVTDFMDLYDGPVYPERKTGGEDCPGSCLDEKQLDRCEAFCECAFVREIIQIIKNKRVV